MAANKKRGRSRSGKADLFFGIFFDAERTRDAKGDVRLLTENPVSVALPPGSSHYDEIVSIAQAAQPPLPIKYIPDSFKAKCAPRGGTYLGQIAYRIDRIVGNYTGLGWWLERDGIVIDAARSAVEHDGICITA